MSDSDLLREIAVKLEHHIASEEGQLTRISTQLESLLASQNQQHETLIRQQYILDEHQRRSTTLEAEFAPVKKHVATVGAIGLVVTGIGGLLGLGSALYEVFKVGRDAGWW